MKCFYHSRDLDGHCAGAVILYFHPACEMIGMDYGDPFPVEDIGPGEVVFLVDFSLPVPQMIDLDERAELVWIDHHLSAIEAVPPGIKGLRSTRFSGCELAWTYLRGARFMPRAVSLLGRYDVWDHSFDDVLSFQYGMRALPETKPDRAFSLWVDLFSGRKVDSILADGAVVRRYVVANDKKVAGLMAFSCVVLGKVAVAINRWPASADMFESVFDPGAHEIMVAYGYKGGRYQVSLFSPAGGVNVGALAKTVGGGGHANAAGYISDNLGFEALPGGARP